MTPKLTAAQREWLLGMLDPDNLSDRCWIPQPIGAQLERKGLVVKGGRCLSDGRQWYTITTAGRAEVSK